MITLEEISAGFALGEFYLEYLPTILLSSRSCVGGEALIRWRRPEGTVSPQDFIPIIENTPISGKLTYWVIDTVAAELTEWLSCYPDVHISINIPPEILGRGGLIYAGEKSGLSQFRQQIFLEITERGLPDRLGLEGIMRLDAHGVTIVLDDVALTGANLAILTRCPFRMIKIDKELVKEIKPDAPQPDWLSNLAALLSNGFIDVTAEGIENAYQAEVLNAAGVKYGQGYFFSKPIPVSTFLNYHADNGF